VHAGPGAELNLTAKVAPDARGGGNINRHRPWRTRPAESSHRHEIRRSAGQNEIPGALVALSAVAIPTSRPQPPLFLLTPKTVIREGTESEGQHSVQGSDNRDFGNEGSIKRNRSNNERLPPNSSKPFSRPMHELMPPLR